jgi:outer membrane protein assembly factor BamA
VAANVPFEEDYTSRRYLQLNTDLRFYHPAFPPRTSVAYRLQTTLRNRDGGKFHIVDAGGETTIRGFGSGSLGLASQANNCMLFTAEYRFPMFRTPSLRLPVIAKIYVADTEVYCRFDGAFFADYAHLWHDLVHTLTAYENGMAFGTGFRLLVLPSNRAVCFDIVPAVVYRGVLISRWTDTRTWGYNLYVDLVF